MKEQDMWSAELSELARRMSELENELKELPAKIEAAYQELFNLRFRLATRQLEDTSQVRKARKQVARLKTAMSELRKEKALLEMVQRAREGR